MIFFKKNNWVDLSMSNKQGYNNNAEECGEKENCLIMPQAINTEMEVREKSLEVKYFLPKAI